MGNKTLATQKTIYNSDFEKWMQELEDNTAGTSVSLHEHLEKALIILGEKTRRTGSGGNTGRSLRIIGLETVLKYLLERINETNGDLNPAILLSIAMACYERSVLILSRQDKVMVEKKKRILLKGLEFVGKVKEGNNKDALRLRGRLFLELEKIDKEGCNVSDLKKALFGAIQNGCTEFANSADDIVLYLKFAEFAKVDGGDKPLPEYVIKSLKSIVESSLQSKGVELKNAKAYYLMENKEDDEKIIECMKIFAKKLESLSFSDPGWSEAAGFVRALEKAGKVCWKKSALLVWDACKKRYEKSTTLDHYWYFGHLMSHYYMADLCFAAQDDLEKKVEVADFLKSKILLHGQSLDDEVERFFEYNRDVRQQRFIKRMEKVYETEKERTSGVNQRGFNEIPKDCVVIHFYLNKYEKKGYAILAYTGRDWGKKEFSCEARLKITGQTVEIIQKKDVPCEIVMGLKGLVGKWYATEEKLIHDLETKIGVGNTTQFKEIILENILRMNLKKFPYVNLFEAFINFQANYCVNHPTEMSVYRKNAADYLVKLCKEVAIAMPFLFDIPFNKHVLFIPSDFLSRIPLHGALDNDDNIFLQNHASCSYLPSWSLAPQNEGKEQEDSEKQIEKRLLKYFEEHDYDELKKSIAWNNPPEDPATPQHLLNGYMPPGILTVLSHGRADVVNSFNAKLILKGGDVTNFDVMKHASLNLDGCSVILGCCEGDLLPPLSDALDEHLSIASAFLFKGATDVLCTTWEVDPEEQLEEVVIFVINQYNSKNNLSQAITEWQKSELFNWKIRKNSKRIYNTIVFRSMGGL